MKVPRVSLADYPKTVNPDVVVDPGSMTAAEVAAQRGAYQVGEASDKLFDTAIKLQEEKDSLAVVDQVTQLRNRTRDYTLELKKRVGKNGIDLQPEARETLTGMIDEMTGTLTSPRQRDLFKRMAAGEMDQTLNSIAGHEVAQMTQYRNDLRQDSLNNAVLGIRNSYGNEQAIQKAVDGHVQQLGVIYFGQDVADYKQSDLSRLQLEALTYTQHWKHTKVANELMTNFAGDYEGMYKHLMNPENYKDLSIEEKNQIGTVIGAEFSRLKAFQKEERDDRAAKLWADYYQIRYGDRRGEPGALAKWHANVVDMTRRGQIDGHVMTGAIAIQNQEIIAARTAETYARQNDPLMRDDPKTAAYWTELVTTNPEAVDIAKLSESLGKGLSYKTFEHIVGVKKAKGTAVWATSNGKIVATQLGQYRKNALFQAGSSPSDVMKNDEGYTTVAKQMESFLLKNPDATADQINAQMKAVMRPYTRGVVSKLLDKISYGIDAGPITVDPYGVTE